MLLILDARVEKEDEAAPPASECDPGPAAVSPEAIDALDGRRGFWLGLLHLRNLKSEERPINVLKCRKEI